MSELIPVACPVADGSYYEKADVDAYVARLKARLAKKGLSNQNLEAQNNKLWKTILFLKWLRCVKTAHSLEDKCRDYCNRAEEWIEENRAFLELEGYENPSLRNLPEGVYPFSRNIKWCSHWSEKWLGFAADLKRMRA